MPEPTAERTLVKSPPELWAEVSDAEALGRHLEPFGEIRITRLEPETTVAWEGDRASGTVSLAPSGWGTKVTLTAELQALEEAEPVVVAAPVAPVEPPPAVEEPPAPVASPAPVEPPRGFFARLFRRSALPVIEEEVVPEPVVAEPEPVVAEPEPVVAEPEPELVLPPPPEPEPAPAEPSLAPEDAQNALTSALDSLGAAHHRPFSRG
jgi:hypothetical protein